MTSNETATAIVLPGIVEPDGLQIRENAVPAPGPGQILIRMEATGVSFAEQQAPAPRRDPCFVRDGGDP
jgi:Zn-dependent alcohol dehydrogenase